MVLNGVDKLLRMFNANTQRKRLGLDSEPLIVKEVEDVAGGMTRSQDHCLTVQFVAVVCCHYSNPAIANDQIRNPFTKVYDTTRFQDALPYGSNDARQPVSADVRMGIIQDVLRCAVRHKDIEYAPDVAPLVRPRIQLAIRIGASPSFTKAIVRVWVYNVMPVDRRQVATPLPHILAPFDNHRSESQLDQPQGSKQSCRTTPHDDHTWRCRTVGICGHMTCWHIPGGVENPTPDADQDVAPSRINGTLKGNDGNTPVGRQRKLF